MKELPVLNWTALQREPIARALLLSACLHVAVLALIQASPGSGKAQTVVINARLELGPPRTPAPPFARKESSEMPAAPAEPESRPVVMTAEAASPAPAFAVPSALPKSEPAPAARTVAPTPSGAAATSAASPGLGPASPSPLPGLPLGIDATWYLARQVDTQPRSIGRIEPSYPQEARKRNREGTLKLMLKIDDLGRVESAEVMEADPPGVFEETALEAFRKARFQPAMKDGRPVRYQAYIRVDFKLED